MTRLQLEHLIGAAGAIANHDDIVVIGSQAILGQFPDARPELLVSPEADVYPRSHPERADLIDGSIGEGSPFERAYGYDAHGVGPETAVLPAGWADDLAVAKLIAGRERGATLAARLAATAVDHERGSLAAARLARYFTE